MPEGNAFLKSQSWRKFLGWLEDTLDNPDVILALSPESSQGASCIDMVGTFAGFRPPTDNAEHRACAQIIISVFYNAGLINMKIGRSEETALLKAVIVGNYEIAMMLLDHGAGHAPCVIPLFLIRELLFGTT